MKIIKKIRQYRLFSLRISSYNFSPGIFSTLVTAALLYTMISLAYWQMDRANFKDTLQQKISQRKNLTPLAIDELPSSKDDRRYLPVKISGEFDDKHSFLLDNKIFNRHVGYHVYTPFKINTSQIILVNRGFVKQGKTRDQLPDVTAASGKIELKGLLDYSPSRAILLAENVQQTSRWPAVLQYVDLDEISQLLNEDIYDMVLWQNPESSGGFDYDLPVLNLNSAKNNGYAFQWFAMSLALFVIYLTVNTKRL